MALRENWLCPLKMHAPDLKPKMKTPKARTERKFEYQFIEVITLIQNSKINALKSVNSELIGLYWKIGEYISKKLERSEWGEGVVGKLADYINAKHPELKGYSDKNLWRMKQFYDTYKESKLSALLRELSWTNNMLIISKSKTDKEREFYMQEKEKRK